MEQSPYILKQAMILAQTLDRMAPLPAHRIAGHIANLDYWKEELERVLISLAGCANRIRRMKEATNEHLKRRPVVDYGLPPDLDHVHALRPDTRTVPAVRDSEILDAKRLIHERAERFARAGYGFNLLSEVQVEDFLSAVHARS